MTLAMTESRRAMLVAAVIGSLGALLLLPGVVRAQTQPSNAFVTITDTFDPTTSAGNISYKITGKNDGTVRSCPIPPSGCSDRPTLEATIPPGATFVSCKTTATFALNPPVLCAVSGAVVTAQFLTVPAHATVTMTLVIKAPIVTAQTTISLRAKFSGESMHMDEKSQSTIIQPPTTRLSMSPSGRTVLIACGYTLDNAMFGADIEGTLMDTMNCNSGSGLTFTASGKTLNLGVHRILSGARVTGNVGIIVGPNATNVTIKGGGTSGPGGRGIEQFEYCVKDLGGNTGLQIMNLRCFGSKTVGILSLSNGVSISNSLVDRTKPDASSETPGVGGIGIQAGGDNIHVKDTQIRRSGCDNPTASSCTSIGIGFWAYGVDADGSGVVATYDGNTTTSRIDSNFGIGVLLSGGPHRIKDTQVQGDDFEAGVSHEGIVVEAGARGTSLDGVVVKKHRGDGIHVETGAMDTVITRTNVEEIGGNGFVIDAQTTLNGNSAKTVLGHGFVVNTSATLTSNNAEECSGNAFVINGAAVVDNNSAADNSGYGFVVSNLSPGSLGTEWSVQGVGDFDGNGKADILWRDTSGSAAIWLTNGTGPGGVTTKVYSVGSDWIVQGVGDFNGDGKADILWRHSSGMVYIWLMDGFNFIGIGSPGVVGTDWTIEGVGDFDGNGKADIVWRHSGGLLAIWLMNATAISSSGSPGSVDAAWTVHGIGDFDGNGKADILWRHSGGLLAIWLMNATTISSTGSPGTVGLDWGIQDVGDFNGDEKADILWRHTSGLVYVWLMDGTAIFGSGSPGSVDNDSIQGVGDFNGDGKADILWRRTSGELSTWVMNGTSLTAASGPARFRTNTAEGNALGGFLVSGGGNVLDDNTANAGGGTGFTISGSGNVLKNNGAERSVGAEFVIGPNNVDGGSNTANGNRFAFPATGGTFE